MKRPFAVSLHFNVILSKESGKRKRLKKNSYCFIAIPQLWFSLTTQASGSWLHNAQSVPVALFISETVSYKDNIITVISLVKIEIYFI